jgi:NADH-quinone oxidoreductase subunit K
MLGAANLNFLAFWRYGPNPAALEGVVFVLFAIAVAAAEAAVGLALIVFAFRHFKTVRINRITNLHG